jgi:hypothetical protein
MIKPPGMIEGGTIRVGDTSLGLLSDKQIRNIRLARLHWFRRTR